MVVKRKFRPVANFGNHPQEKSSIGLKTVEYSPDFNPKLEAIQTKNTDPLACKEQLKIVHHSLLHDDAQFQEHKRDVHDENNIDNKNTIFKCSICEKQFNDVAQVKEHKRDVHVENNTENIENMTKSDIRSHFQESDHLLCLTCGSKLNKASKLAGLVKHLKSKKHMDGKKPITQNMAIQVVEFSSRGYKIRKIFA